MWWGFALKSVSDWALWSEEVPECREVHPPSRQLCHQPAMRLKARLHSSAFWLQHSPSLFCGRSFCSSHAHIQGLHTLHDSPEGEVYMGHPGVLKGADKWVPPGAYTLHTGMPWEPIPCLLYSGLWAKLTRSWIWSLVGFSGNRITEQTRIWRSYYTGRRTETKGHFERK